MLKKMLIHGLIAAAVIGYATGRDDGYAMDNVASALQAGTNGRATPGNGYVTDGGKRTDHAGFFGFFQAHDHDRDDDHSERTGHHRKHHDHDDD